MSEAERCHIELLFRTQYTMLVQLAQRKTENKELSEELVQSVFMVACIKSAELLQHPNPIGWLVKTLQLLILKAKRSEYYRTAYQLEYHTEPIIMMEPSLEILFPKSLTTHEVVALQMRIEDNASYQDIAAALGLSEANCRKIISRALKKCRASYEEK